MTFLTAMAACGGLLLVIALSSAFLRRLPISTAIVYLAVGVALGPFGLGWLRIDLHDVRPWFARLTEVAVIVSLFVGGLKLRAPIGAAAWRAAFLLAGPVMLVSIVGVAAFAHYVLGLPASAAILLGAVLAPTDPVLASAVAVGDASDHDRMRYGLSGEAGLNDGMAFPFVVFALLWAEHGGPGSWVAGWAAHRLLWAIPTALAIGYLGGLAVGRIAISLRTGQRDDPAPNDFLALALIALSYVAAETIGAWGFLSAFAAGVGLRRAELRVVRDNPHPHAHLAPGGEVAGLQHPPAEDLVPPRVGTKELEQPAVAAGVLVAETLSFGATAERLLEVTLIVLVGTCVVTHWDLRALPVAVLLFFAIRPLAVALCLVHSPTTRRQRLLMSWFGIRGIGSLYYLAYALREGGDAPLITNLTVSVVALSVVLHGASSRPVIDAYERSLARLHPTTGGPPAR